MNIDCFCQPDEPFPPFPNNSPNPSEQTSFHDGTLQLWCPAPHHPPLQGSLVLLAPVFEHSCDPWWFSTRAICKLEEYSQCYLGLLSFVVKQTGLLLLDRVKTSQRGTGFQEGTEKDADFTWVSKVPRNAVLPSMLLSYFSIVPENPQHCSRKSIIPLP